MASRNKGHLNRGRRWVIAALFGLAAPLFVGVTTAGEALAVVCTVAGTAGNDVLTGTPGPDVICGEGGNDVLRGLAGDDELYGGPGNDILEPGSGDDLMVDGGIGADTVGYPDIIGFGVTIDLGTRTASGTTAGSDVLASIERAEGTPQNDTLTGSIAADWLTGRDGNDSLNGLDGADVLHPGIGDDAVIGGAGVDVVRYNDVTIGGVTIDLGAGTETGPSGSDTFTGIERASGTNQADTIAGSPGDDMLWGAGGIDTIDGLAGNDTILPGAGNDPSIEGGLGIDTVNYSDVPTFGGTIDIGVGTTSGTTIGSDVLANFENVVGTRQADTLSGTNGNNSMIGLDGNDRIFGLGGNDVLMPGTGSDSVIDGGGGVDTISYSDLTSGVTVNLPGSSGGTAIEPDGVSNIENIVGSSGPDTLTGDAADNTIEGLAGADRLRGGVGDNTLLGGTGDDNLRTGTGNDTLDGGANDTDPPGDLCNAGGSFDFLDDVTNCEGDSNNAPTAVDDGGVGFTTNESTPIEITVLANDTDPDGDPLSLSSLYIAGFQGQLIQNGGGSLTYDPNGAFNHLTLGQTATDVFSYEMGDDAGGFDVATVTITITGV